MPSSPIIESYLKQSLAQYGDVSPAQWLPTLSDSPFHYRRRVRLGVRVTSNSELIIGFHRKQRSYLLNIQVCPVLDPRLHMLLGPLHQLVEQLSVRQRLPQIEMSSGESEVAVVLRHLIPLSENDRVLLREFAELHKVLVFTHACNRDSIEPLLDTQATTLQYSFPLHQIRLTYTATDFIQANAQVNQLLLEQVIAQLDVQEQDVVLDLFCGIGNFSLPLARYARAVIGIDGHPDLVAQARYNADHNGLRNVQFQHADLTNWSPDIQCNKLLIDPPRGGAMDVIKRLPELIADTIVYVSCQPRTLARDAGYLVHRLGYTLTKAGVVDMFPQTKHVEAIAVFQR
jgi:23S rRNA (uracil1939-C5)-methyltransferase